MLLYYYCNQTILCEQALCDSGKKEVLLNRKRPLAESGSGRRSHLPSTQEFEMVIRIIFIWPSLCT